MSKKSPPELGKALQALRKSQRLTLDQLAASSGISKSMLSQIERGQSNPTFSTLWNLTQALGVEITDILQEQESTASAPAVLEHLQAHFTPTIQSPDGKCALKILSPFSSVADLEWYEMRLQQGGQLQSAAHQDGTLEHLTVMEGEASVQTGSEITQVKKGETLRYRADLPHTISNTGSTETLALLVVDSPS